MTTIKDRELAAELVDRLNRLIEDEAARHIVHRLCNDKYPASQLEDHPTIQVGRDGVGMLGILNGLIGIMASRPGWGHIARVLDDETGQLLSFQLVDEGST